jgi:hypothetical protein
MKYLLGLLKINFLKKDDFFLKEAILITPVFKNLFIKTFYYFFYSLLLFLIFKNLVHYSFVIMDVFITKFKIFEIFNSKILTKEKFLSLEFYIVFILKIYYIFYYLILLNNNLYLKIYVDKNCLCIIKMGLLEYTKLTIPLKQILYYKISQNILKKLLGIIDINFNIHNDIIIKNIKIDLNTFIQHYNDAH